MKPVMTENDYDETNNLFNKKNSKKNKKIFSNRPSTSPEKTKR
jgi:hypothetical protein